METKDKSNLYSLLDKSVQSTKIKNYSKGEVAEGVVVMLGDGFMVVKIDGVFEALVPGGEMIKEGKMPEPGDVIKVFVLKPEDEFGVMIVSQKRTSTGQRWELLEEAKKNDEPVVVSVIEANSGGLITNIDGVVGFIPVSQLDPNRVYKLESDGSNRADQQRVVASKLNEMIGSKITVKVMEIDKEKNKAIFSEKMLLSEQPSELRKQTIENVKVGESMEATVTAVASYGIFVNANGLDGLVHVSEISWDKVENPADYAKVGDKIKVKLIDISDDGRRVAYSLKQLSDDPWTELSSEFKIGGIVSGTVTEVEDYGLIIKIGEGVTGLIHKSELSDKIIGDPKDHFKIGDEVTAMILTISPNERKMGLSIKKTLKSSSGVGTERKKSSSSRKSPVIGSLNLDDALAKAGLELSAEEEESQVQDSQEVEEVKSETKTKAKPVKKAVTKKKTVKKISKKTEVKE